MLKYVMVNAFSAKGITSIARIAPNIDFRFSLMHLVLMLSYKNKRQDNNVR